MDVSVFAMPVDILRDVKLFVELGQVPFKARSAWPERL